MSINFSFLRTLLLMTPNAVVLSVFIGVGGRGCPMNLRAWQAGTAFLQLIQRAPTSASAVDDMTALIICAVLRKAPLLGGFTVLLNMKM